MRPKIFETETISQKWVSRRDSRRRSSLETPSLSKLLLGSRLQFWVGHTRWVISWHFSVNQRMNIAGAYLINVHDISATAVIVQ